MLAVNGIDYIVVAWLSPAIGSLQDLSIVPSTRDLVEKLVEIGPYSVFKVNSPESARIGPDPARRLPGGLPPD